MFNLFLLRARSVPVRVDFINKIKSACYELLVKSVGFPGGRIGGNGTEKLCEMTQKLGKRGRFAKVLNLWCAEGEGYADRVNFTVG
jgi:hypothetical protein